MILLLDMLIIIYILFNIYFTCKNLIIIIIIGTYKRIINIIFCKILEYNDLGKEQVKNAKLIFNKPLLGVG